MRNTTVGRALGVGFAALAAGSASAQQRIVGIGILPGGLSSWATGVSDDGGVVLAISTAAPASPGAAPSQPACVWTANGGLRSLGTLGGSGSLMSGYGLSADGTVAVGAMDAGGSGSAAFRWTAAAGFQALPFPPDGTEGGAWGVSADGNVAVGWCRRIGQVGRAARWSGPFTFLDLGTLPGHTWSEAAAANQGGSVIVGRSARSTAPVQRRAFRWTQAGGIQDLGVPPGFASARALAVNRAGDVVAGTVGIGDDFTGEAFRWTPAEGMRPLGVLWGWDYSMAEGMNADGSLVVGWSFRIEPFALSGRAFVWSQPEGMVGLETYLAVRGFDLENWTLEEAVAISADGRTIVGRGLRGMSEVGFVATIWPDPSCYANRDGSTRAPVLNISDFVAFIGQFAAGSLQANCDGSTVPPMLNINDFSCFMARFGAGCS